MKELTYTSQVPISAEELYNWHAQPGALQRLSPPWEPMDVVERTGGIEDGARMVAKIGPPGPIKLTWVADHRDHIKNRQFVDEQTSGPFNTWIHTHRFIPDGEHASTMRDEVQYKLPLSPLSDIIAGSYVRGRLERMFNFRHTRLKQDIALHQRYKDHPKLTVAITGASGLLGTALEAFLATGGHSVKRLVRKAPKGDDEIGWKPSEMQIDAQALEGVDAVIHLAGAGIADKRWTPERKRIILESRQKGTQLIAQTIQNLKNPPKVLLSASAVGYYGNTHQHVDESSSAGKGFLADVCKAWEEALAPLTRPDVRVARMRIGVVLTPTGGALEKMLLPFQMGLGGPVGSGKQPMPWISIDDITQAFYAALFEDWSGPINLVAPQTLTQKEFAKALGRVLKRPTFAPLPELAVKAMFGEMGERVLLEGAPVQPTFLTKHNFPFYHRDIDTALRHVLGR